MNDNDFDFSVENHGSLYLFQAHTSEAFEHLQAHVGEEAQWLGRALAVEPRYALDLATQLTNDGFTVR